jgi:hypothetical protein
METLVSWSLPSRRQSSYFLFEDQEKLDSRLRGNDELVTDLGELADWFKRAGDWFRRSAGLFRRSTELFRRSAELFRRSAGFGDDPLTYLDVP